MTRPLTPADYIATPRLRWVAHTEWLETGHDSFQKRVRTLQQWWVLPVAETPEEEGEWRDIEVVDERDA